jgi:hypothetical protein
VLLPVLGDARLAQLTEDTIDAHLAEMVSL